ncbi:chloride channel protein [Mesohalobacter halotolerans]|uniref:Chloride channel protein n=1 Tax=Mesohalobacter halotolerans TaxID=1883405 RepID=A0A4U5TPT4_9FLAO|nr:chloride channel protein [Mesohalobacter halotolerans]MBS3737618.1 chloride channel protein [Psychroflexus sp.]TKS55448.1 chloride channel protein [Mesohalobacter halotolerans]
MNNFSQHKILFKIIRWKEEYLSHHQFVIILSALIGFTAGLVAVTLKNLAYLLQDWVEKGLLFTFEQVYYFIFPFIGLLLTYLILNHILKARIGQGISSTLFAISQRKGFVKTIQSYASLITAPLTVGLGGSVGLESPTVATSAGLGSILSRYFKVNQATRTLLIGCAAAGAMSSLFKAPIAAIIFAIEIFALDLTLVSMIPLLVASVSAILTSYFFFGSNIILQPQTTSAFQIQDFLYYVILAIICAGFSLLFIKIYTMTFSVFEKFSSKFKRAVIGGMFLGLLIFVFPQLYGEGYPFVNQLLSGDMSFWVNSKLNFGWNNLWFFIGFLFLVMVFKILATSVTIASGGVGGIFAPVLFIGSIIGTCYALIIKQFDLLSNSISDNNFALVGMAGLMSGVMHAPLTAIFLIAEITSGYNLFIPLMICVAISYGISHRFQKHSIYNLELAQRGQLVTHDKDETVLSLLEINQLIERNFVILRIDMSLENIVNEGVVKSSRNIFPVTDQQGKFKGILLLDDIRTLMFKQDLYQDVFVSDLMQTAPDVIELTDCNAKDVMRKFKETDAWNLPVVREGKYVGFISKSKMLTAYRDKLVDLSIQ